MAERICWAVLALIHTSPFAAFFAPKLLERLYGVGPHDPAFALLHHRAALFGCVLIACVWAIWGEDVRKLATVIVALSMGAFLFIYFANGSHVALRTIAIADLVGLPFLAFAGWRAFTGPAG